ncbi:MULTISPECIES: HlyU family transcriptional regulator [Aliivibrio]|uniref:Transcriptional regulator n=1 Tax=Aliivibrio finisterrensis TaxID=511998 RepID=A0A4Q5KWF2_9GAMM|nr:MULTISPECIES: HlyU family transcriptional regulator [Aliivibrio]MDD9180646.1 HlyU family transcriptional regulator [Aliivibrio sp. A6]RYU49570.1 transcriptional regulator [Aliivibrio finisterrensis]RYU53303.1 transcriptional regulator [Aliivibrio finisterrensis]RYU55414.1 transcriptional regulator [Aliivibrio finisterrensis]RYU65810.1 transcriptional regulator [Aliivibrio finisterrensis]
MGLFSRLFGTSPKQEATIEPIEYQSFLIYPNSERDGSQFRIAGTITKEIKGEIKEHRFIRSDVISNKSDADELMVRKSKMLIEQMNESIFN